MRPIGDDDSERRSFPVMTLTLIAINIVVFWQEVQGTSFQRITMAYAMIPFEITHGQDIGPPGPHPIYLTLLTSMFMHATWMHLGGNMLFLWIFGRHLEDRMGPVKSLIFYLICGLAASATQILISPDSQVPCIGAGGAIGGVLGGYLLLLPQARVRTHGRYLISDVLAWIMLGFWMLTHVLAGMAQWGGKEMSGGAHAIHVGGFATGLILVKLFTPAGARPARAIA